MAEDDLTIPDFLRISDKDRKKAWEKFKPKKVRNLVVAYDSRKPASMSVEEWETRKAERKEEERKREEEREAQKRAKAPPVPVVDIKGKRWDQRRGRWVEDTRPAPGPAKAPIPHAKPKSAPRKGVPASGFGIPEGTNRDKLAKAMVKRLGEMVSLIEWSKAVYGKENASACDRVMNGFILDLKKRKLKFEIIKDKNSKGQIAYGLFEITE